MPRRKEILAAGYVRDIRFLNDDASFEYIQKLDHLGLEYKILDTAMMSDGSIILRVLQQYNNCPLIQLFEEG